MVVADNDVIINTTTTTDVNGSNTGGIALTSTGGELVVQTAMGAVTLAASFAPIPGVKELGSLVEKIYDTCKRVKKNRYVLLRVFLYSAG